MWIVVVISYVLSYALLYMPPNHVKIYRQATAAAH